MARAQARLAAFADHLRAQQKAAIATAGGGLCIAILPPPPGDSYLVNHLLVDAHHFVAVL